MSEVLADVVRESGLVGEDDRLVVLVSGGADSAACAAGVAAAIGPEQIRALHLNYGLRDDSDEDEAVAAALCRRLGIDIEVGRPRLEAGNLQGEARRARYDAAESLRARLGFDSVATGHTRTDLAETVLYRLVTSPGRRPLLGLPSRGGPGGRLVRPLLAVSRRRVRELATEARLPFRDDPSNEDLTFSRNRIRHEVMPVLRELAPAVEETIAASWAELSEESELLESLASEALGASGAVALPVDELRTVHPALARLALRRHAEGIAGRPVPLGRERTAEILRLGEGPEGGTVELGSGLRASVEAGHVRFLNDPGAPPGEALLHVPGSCSLGPWRLRAELVEPVPEASPGPEVAALDAAKLGEQLRVRTWREGDRIKPLGLGGTKSLQDLFTDAKVPRSLRRELPVIVAGEEIAWVVGVAVSEEFKLGPQTTRSALLHASHA